MRLKCKNKRCGYSWDYNGDNPFYATCPRCKSSVKVKNGKVRTKINVQKEV